MDNANGSSSSSLSPRKRRRVDDVDVDAANHDSDTDQTLSLEASLTFSDTLVALRIMRAQFPRIDKVKVSIQPFILRSQLYSSVKDRTQVDRELESLRRGKVLRIFKLNTGQDDHAIMFMDDYLTQIELAVKRVEARKQDALAVFECFRTHVIISKLEPNIEHQELWSLLSLGGKVKDEHISLLINAGLLTRQLIDPNMYWFSIPSIGSVLKGLSQSNSGPVYEMTINRGFNGGRTKLISVFWGMVRLMCIRKQHVIPMMATDQPWHPVGRKELLSILNRKKYKEMMLAALEKKHLRFSPLDMRFHLRDLIGSGHLKTHHRPTGLFIQVSKD